jgi:hypothetical protein
VIILTYKTRGSPSMVCTPQLFILDDKLVAVFKVKQRFYSVKMECLISIDGLEDYTIEFNGEIENKEEIIEFLLSEANKLHAKDILLPNLG